MYIQYTVSICPEYYRYNDCISTEYNAQLSKSNLFNYCSGLLGTYWIRVTIKYHDICAVGSNVLNKANMSCTVGWAIKYTHT